MKTNPRVVRFILASAMPLPVLISCMMAMPLLTGCSRAPERAVMPLFRPSPDKDVTTSPYYNFSPFTNTVWKTRTKTAVVDVKRYTGAHDIKLLPPKYFDPTESDYTTVYDTQIVAVLPPGNHLRITRLLQDQGAGGFLQVEAVLLDGTNAQKAIFLNDLLLAGNAWTIGPTSNTNWDANPALLDKP